MHASSRKIGDVIPMSPLSAPAFCCSTVGTFAFQPKRPSAFALRVRASATRLARPEIPSPSSSAGSARSRIVRSGTASSRPTPNTPGATRGLICTPFGNGPNAGSAIV